MKENCEKEEKERLVEAGEEFSCDQEGIAGVKFHE